MSNVSVNDLPPVHPAAKIFPMMSKVELNSLADDIQDRGQETAIVMWKGEILDGRNRWLACKIADVDPITEEWDGEGSPTSFVISHNLKRRQLSQGQKAVVANKIKASYALEAKAAQAAAGGDKKSEKAKSLPSKSQGSDSRHQNESSNKAAKDVKAGQRSTATIARIEKEAPELVECVEQDILNITQADKVSRMPSKQRAIVVHQINHGVEAAVAIKEAQEDNTGLTQINAAVEDATKKARAVFNSFQHLLNLIERYGANVGGEQINLIKGHIYTTRVTLNECVKLMEGKNE